MYKSILTFIILLSPVLARADDHYTVQFDQALKSVTVEACFDGSAPRHLYRNSHSGRHTNWVRINGDEFPHYRRGSRFSLPNMNDDSCVSWQVGLNSALAEDDYRLAMKSGSDILTSGDLWFWRDGDKRPVTVEVRLPEGYSLSAPWKYVSAAPGRNFYRPDATPVSWSSRIAIGQFRTEQIPLGNSILRLALVGDLDDEQRQKLTRWVRENAAAVMSVYGRFPRKSPQILIVPVGHRDRPVIWAHVIRGGGIAVEFFVDETDSLENLRDDWHATHEFSHLLLPYVSRSDRWLSEGLASYYQNVLRARDGRLSEQQAWQKLQSGFERGRAASVDDNPAAATRSAWDSTMRVYWSGAAFMLLADTRLRMSSQGKQSLDTTLAELEACCLNSQRTWRARELIEKLDHLSGTSVFSELYQEHVKSEEFPDLSQTFEQLGLILESESLKLKPNAPWESIRLQIMDG
jgi:predicted metalloprotease with PDZ domain